MNAIVHRAQPKLGYASLVVCLLAWIGPPAGAQAGDRIVRCESEPGRFVRCPIDQHDEVTLFRQLSTAPCTRPETWGSDDASIWVADGCRADFRVSGGEEKPSVESALLRCESIAGRRRYCPADTSGGVALVRRLGEEECEEGRTWGWDDLGVWVAAGCQAEFRLSAVGTTGAAGGASEPDAGADPSFGETDNGDEAFGDGTPGGLGEREPRFVRCLSDAGERSLCPADTRAGVTLEVQLGETTCLWGDSWTFDERGIRVSDGCRGEFRLGNLDELAGRGVERIRCESLDGRLAYCEAGGEIAGDVVLVEALGGAPCREGETWGHDRYGVWVTERCAGLFEVTGIEGERAGEGEAAGPPEGDPSPGEAPPRVFGVRCESKENRRAFCPVDTAPGVRLYRQLSQSPCEEGVSWGTTPRGIWVDRGCRALFVVGG